MKNYILFIFLGFFGYSFSQSTDIFVVNEDQEPIPYSQIYFPELDFGGVCDSVGHFSAGVDIEGKVLIQISALGYQTIRKTVDFQVEIESVFKPKLVFTLEHLHFDLNEVEVRSGLGELQSENVAALEVKRIEELNEISGTTIGDNLGKINGVQVLSLGKGISKPVIRGLSGVRVITYFDGLRLENQQWGGDHGLNVASPGIGAVEVIKGPASLLYGADAIGGVIYFSEKTYPPVNSLDFQMETGFESNTLGSNTSFSLGVSKEKFRINVYGGYMNHADYQLPNGMKVVNSRFYMANGGLSLSFHRKNWYSKVRYNYMYNSNGVPGHTHDSVAVLEDFLSDNRLRSETAPVQKIHNHSILWENKWFLKKGQIKLSIGNTNNNLAEHDEKITIPGININLNNTFFNGLWKGVFGKNEVYAGVQGMLAFSRNNPIAEEVLIPSNNQIDAGVFAVYSRKIKDWKIQAGLRFDTRTLSADTLFNKTFYGVNFSAGAVYKKKPVLLRINLSSGIRPPHVSELLANGPHHGSTRYEIGNRNLKSENSYQADVNLRLSFEHIDLVINPFYNFINNYIYIQPTEELIGSYEVYRYKQAEVAHLFGGEFGLHYHPHFAHWLHWETNFSYVHTLDGNGRGFPYTPPVSLTNTLKFNFNFKKKKVASFNAILSYSYFFRQNNLAVFETASKDIHLLDVGFNLKFATHPNINLKWGVRNALNYNYVPHLSNLRELQIPSGGYNIYFSIQLQLKHKLK